MKVGIKQFIIFVSKIFFYEIPDFALIKYPFEIIVSDR